MLLTVATLAGVVAFTARASGHADEEASPIYGVKIPRGYRDWRLISVANVGAPVNDIRAKLGNDVAMKAYRERKLPFPDGTIIARLAWQQVTSEENSNAIGRVAEKRLPPEQVKKLLDESFVAGPHQRPVHGQGFNKICFDRRLGFRPIRRWQTWRRGDPQNLFFLSRATTLSSLVTHPNSENGSRKK